MAINTITSASSVNVKLRNVVTSRDHNAYAARAVTIGGRPARGCARCSPEVSTRDPVELLWLQGSICCEFEKSRV